MFLIFLRFHYVFEKSTHSRYIIQMMISYLGFA